MAVTGAIDQEFRRCPQYGVYNILCFAICQRFSLTIMFLILLAVDAGSVLVGRIGCRVRSPWIRPQTEDRPEGYEILQEVLLLRRRKTYKDWTTRVACAVR